jgi:hypothetical protein
VRHIAALPITLKKYFKAKEELREFKNIISPFKNVIFKNQKIPLKKNPNPS